MNKRVFWIIGVLVLVSSRPSLSEEASKEAKSADEVVSTLRKYHLPVHHVPTKDLTVKALAGQYSNGATFLFVAGNELYLLHDATYIYTKWADIIPETVCDKGTWSVKDGSLILKSDGSVPDGEKPRDQVYWPLLLESSAQVRLMGHRDFSSFVANKPPKNEGNATVRFMQYNFSQRRKLSKVAQEEKRKELMTGARKPDFSKDEPAKR